MKKVLYKAFSLFVYLTIVILVLLAYGSTGNRWYRVVTVEGNSMSPTLWYGDLMVVTPPTSKIPVETVVVISIDGSLVTHRVVGFDENGNPITKGDANEVVDNFTNPDLKIVGIYRLRLPGFGYPILLLSGLMGRS